MCMHHNILMDLDPLNLRVCSLGQLNSKIHIYKEITLTKLHIVMKTDMSQHLLGQFTNFKYKVGGSGQH